MELLNESESRAFSSFLDSFASTSSTSPPPHLPLPSTSSAAFPPAPQYHMPFQPPNGLPQGGQYPMGTARRESDNGGEGDGGNAAEYTSRSSGGGSWEREGGRLATGAYDPRLQQSPTSSFPSSTLIPQSEFAPPLPPPPVNRRPSNPYQVSEVDASEAAKQRKLQHAEELQKWMLQSQSQPRTNPQTRSSLDSPSPPKRTKSSETTRGMSGEGQDPIAAMLEAERKAGYAFGRSMNAAFTREASQPRRISLPASTFKVEEPQEREVESRETFAPPPPPAAFRSSRRRPSSTTTAETFALPLIPSSHASDHLDASPGPKPTPVQTKTKRKAPASSTSHSRSNSVASEQQQHHGESSHPIRGPSETPSTVLDPESADVNLSSISPIPFQTPSNIPPPLDLSAAQQRPRRKRATSPPPSLSTSTSNSKANGTLLTNEQKKANHIASEQKRRAAIRQAYDGLCDVVPVLRAAVDEFEERVRRLENEGTTSRGGGRGGAKKKKGKVEGNKTGALMGGINVGGEKIDGRAGPKSEAVVLSKSECLSRSAMRFS